MYSSLKTVLPIALLCAGSSGLLAQQFPLLGKQVQVHGFVSQGFAYSNQNNFLTMETSKGAFNFTDGALNLSTALTDRFRVGAQAYVRNIGRLGEGHVTLDWAYGDYKFAQWFGVRAGKVKTALGLFNDTQDMEFLHTWAILPQSIYPMDLRSSTIAHVGGDIYGEVSLKKLGSVAYVAYGGTRPDDPRGGKAYVLKDYGLPLTKPLTGMMAGFDLRWNTMVPGLILGGSFNDNSFSGAGLLQDYRLNLNFDTKTDTINAFYADFTKNNLHLTAEYRRNWSVVGFKAPIPIADVSADQRSWYVAGAYRVHRKLELGTYYSSYVYDSRLRASLNDNHIYDKTITARFDITKNWNVKVEGHFMDGFGAPASSRGFYLIDNPSGVKPTTNMLVIRTGFSL